MTAHLSLWTTNANVRRAMFSPYDWTPRPAPAVERESVLSSVAMLWANDGGTYSEPPATGQASRYTYENVLSSDRYPQAGGLERERAQPVVNLALPVGTDNPVAWWTEVMDSAARVSSVVRGRVQLAPQEEPLESFEASLNSLPYSDPPEVDWDRRDELLSAEGTRTLTSAEQAELAMFGRIVALIDAEEALRNRLARAQLLRQHARAFTILSTLSDELKRLEERMLREER